MGNGREQGTQLGRWGGTCWISGTCEASMLMEVQSEARGKWPRRRFGCPWAYCPTYRNKRGSQQEELRPAMGPGQHQPLGVGGKPGTSKGSWAGVVREVEAEQRPRQNRTATRCCSVVCEHVTQEQQEGLKVTTHQALLGDKAGAPGSLPSHNAGNSQTGVEWVTPCAPRASGLAVPGASAVASCSAL